MCGHPLLCGSQTLSRQLCPLSVKQNRTSWAPLGFQNRIPRPGDDPSRLCITDLGSTWALWSPWSLWWRRADGGAKMANPFLKQVFNKDKTFRPKRKFEPGTQRFELHKRAQASLNAGLDLRLAVQLPPGEELSDWVAVHVVDFFNRVNLIYGTISEGCTAQSCPVMSGGPKYEYRWQDDHRFRKPTALPAPQYMDLLLDWIEVQINNEELFPTSVGTPFPRNFLPVVKKILSRLFRVFVHVYIHHFDRIAQMGSEAHVNTCYKHFYYFVTEFSLIDTKELEPLVSGRERNDRSDVPLRASALSTGPCPGPRLRKVTIF
ncbi:hypothetical protein MC885_002619 [Smutsia gigantea]|nr:hypothetical protein MC885_002619 [Smutsia gigantea]